MKITFDITEQFTRVLTGVCDSSGTKQYLGDIKRSLAIIMANQEDFDVKITAANTALDAIGEAVAAEAKQIADFIAANPTIDTSALDGVVSRLEAVDDNISTVFEPATPPPA